MKTYTTKLTILTLLLTVAGFVFAEDHPPCPDKRNPEGEKIQAGQHHRNRSGKPEGRGKRQNIDKMRRRGGEAMEWLKNKSPKKFEKLCQLKQNKETRGEFFKEMRNVMKEFMKEKNPEMFKMHEKDRKNNQKIKKLLTKFKKAEKPEKKAEIKTKIKEILANQFDFKQKMKTKEVNKLESRTSKLKESLELRLKNKESIVKTRLKSIIEGKEAVEW